MHLVGFIIRIQIPLHADMTKTMTTNIAKGQNNSSVSHYNLISVLAYLMMLSVLCKSYSDECWDDSE